MQYRLPAAHEPPKNPQTLQPMSPLLQLAANNVGHSRFYHQVAAAQRNLSESRRFERGLNIHPVIHYVAHKLHLSLRLIHTPHDAEGDVLRALLQKGGNDGVEGTLARRERVGMRGIEFEVRTPVVQ